MKGIKCLLATAILALLYTEVARGTPCERTSACLKSPGTLESDDGDSYSYNLTSLTAFSNGDKNTQYQVMTRKLKAGKNDDVVVVNKGYIESMGTASDLDYYQKIEILSETQVSMEESGFLFKVEGNGTFFANDSDSSMESIVNVTTFGSGSQVATFKNTSTKFVADNTLIILKPGLPYKVSVVTDFDTKDDNGDEMARGVEVVTYEPAKENTDPNVFRGQQVVDLNVKISKEGVISGEGEGTQITKDGDMTFKSKLEGYISNPDGVSQKLPDDLLAHIIRTMVNLPKL